MTPKTKSKKPVVKLGDGDAVAILFRCRRALIKAGMPEKADEFKKEATSGDYDHLLQTAMKYCDVEQEDK